MEKPLISIIFPSFNGEKVIRRNLDSIKNLSNISDIEILIIDNNSTDSTKKIINSFNTLNISQIQMNSNLGFAKACNIGVKESLGHYIFITNQDVIFPIEFFEVTLELFLNLEEKFGELILCPAIVFTNNTINYFGGKIHYSCISYTPKMYLQMPEEIQILKTIKVSGCSMFLRKQTFLDLNGFDSKFFMYKEDIDLGLRAIRKNIKVYTTNKVQLIHQKRHMILDDFSYYFLERNRYLCLVKHIKKLKKIIPFLIFIELILLIQSILEKKIHNKIKTYKFILFNFKKLKRIRQNSNRDTMLDKSYFNYKFDPITLGKFKTNRLMILALKLINLLSKLTYRYTDF